jgi:opacity protein-like surface antigen
MKKTLLITALVFTSLFVSAQVKDGAKAGLNLANAKIGGSNSTISLDLKTSVRTSFYFGGLAEFPLANENNKIQVELLYSQLGAVAKESDSLEETTIKISQLTIPVIAKYKVYENINLYGGSYIGFNINAGEEYEDGETYDASDDYQTFDVGLIVGAEYNFGNGIFVEARYNYGLINNFNVD